MLRSDLKRLEEMDSSEKRTVNLLPALDPYPMGYTKRERYLDPRLRDNVFDCSGNITSTIMLDGRVVGVWDLSGDRQPCVKLLLFEKADQNVLDEIRFKARRTGRFFFDKDIETKECDHMTPLTRRTAGGFMSPLKNC
jgi:hypothetical protein